MQKSNRLFFTVRGFSDAPGVWNFKKKTAREFLLFFVVALVIIQATYVFLRCYGSQFYEIVLEFYFFQSFTSRFASTTTHTWETSTANGFNYWIFCKSCRWGTVCQEDTILGTTGSFRHERRFCLMCIGVREYVHCAYTMEQRYEREPANSKHTSKLFTWRDPDFFLTGL